jgi:hypothetical protein
VPCSDTGAVDRDGRRVFLFLAGRFAVSSIPPSQLLLLIIRLLDEASARPFTVVYSHTACGALHPQIQSPLLIKAIVVPKAESASSHRINTMLNIACFDLNPSFLLFVRIGQLALSSSRQEYLRFSHTAVSSCFRCCFGGLLLSIFSC